MITIESVRNAFDRFKSVWEFDDFWTRGNTFEACLRCYIAAENKWGPINPNVMAMQATVSQVVTGNVDYYYDHSFGDWADDFGWWGISSLTAWGYLRKTNAALAAQYLDIAKDCWCHMYGQGYDSKNDPPASPVAHGCANAGGQNAGTKNTVTNVNFLLISIRLYGAAKAIGDPSATRYLAMAYAQYVWFQAWFNNSYVDVPYFRTPPGGPQQASLVQERPHAAPDYLSTTDPTWKQGWTWTGDQGLVLASLIELSGLAGDIAKWAAASKPPIFFDPNAFRSELSGWVGRLTNGMQSLLFSAPDKVLREPPFDSSFVDDPKDYVCGRGVLLRYFAEVSSALPAVNLKSQILATATAALASCDSANQFGANWTSTASNTAFNQTFLAAWKYGEVTNVEWSIPSSTPDEVRYGVLQGLGLDVLGAAIPLI